MSLDQPGKVLSVSFMTYLICFDKE
jgi:hypothetical protein